MAQAIESMPVNGTRTKGLLLVAVVFALGLICGSALTVIGARTVWPVGPRHGDRPPHREGAGHVGILSQELGLDENQRAQVAEILDRNRREAHAIFKHSRTEIDAILTEEQRAKFTELRRRHHGPMRGRRPGPGAEGAPRP